jgi:signal transduction histidine kinase/CheY-like chemotaxis protein
VAQKLLEEAGVPVLVCEGYRCLCAQLGEDALFATVTEEALRGADLGPVARYVRGQPVWSSLPFIILTRHGGGPERNPEAARLSNLLQNVTFLERPFHGTTFVSVAQSAMRHRLRQFEARENDRTLRQSEEALRHLNETLEDRVAARTAELEQAHALVLAEIAQREQAEEELRQAQKMEVLGKFTGGVAHDFNNLLMAVMANLELLTKHLPGDPKAARLIDGAMKGARRGAALTQRLLAFARRQDLKVEPRDLSALVRASEELLRRSLGNAVELELDLMDPAPLAAVDENQFDLALLNLVVNARDAMPDGGLVRVSVDHVAATSCEDEPDPGHVRLRVEDKGCGMDAATLDQATQPFFSTKELGKGTGLGLSMIQGLAVQLGGKLILSSTVGKGTVAELWLPVTLAMPPRPAPAEPVAPAPAGPEERSVRLLFVDDDVLIAMSSVEMLRDLGHEVTEAHSGSQALALLGEGKEFDLMITDFSMPKMNGGQLSAAVRELRPGLPILLATGYAELPEGEELDLPRLGKPYAQRQLQDMIRDLLR